MHFQGILDYISLFLRLNLFYRIDSWLDLLKLCPSYVVYDDDCERGNNIFFYIFCPGNNPIKLKILWNYNQMALL